MVGRELLVSCPLREDHMSALQVQRLNCENVAELLEVWAKGGRALWMTTMRERSVMDTNLSRRMKDLLETSCNLLALTWVS